MHNMSDCCKYEKDGKLKQSFGKGQCGSTASDKKTASAFAQLSAKVAKVERQTRSSRRVCVNASTITPATAMTPTPLDGVGPVPHGGTTVVKLN